MSKDLVLDIETDSLDVGTAKVKFLGMYDISGDEYVLVKYDPGLNNEYLEYINGFDNIICHNGQEFDLPILANNGLYVKKNVIDTLKIFKYKRAAFFHFKSYSLKNIVKELKLDEEGKGDIDYKIFRKDTWTEEEIDEIRIYLKKDLELTYKLFKYLCDFFEPYKEYIKQEDVERYAHIKTSLGTYTYKAFCNLLGVEEVYDDTAQSSNYVGAVVFQPKKESAKEVIHFDFTSLYPFMYMMGNLFSSNCSCCKEEEKWSGDEVLKVKGKYCSKKMGKVEELIKQIFIRRKEYKRIGDKRQAALKLIINTFYGVSAKPVFKNFYNLQSASDCTSLGRQCIEFVKKGFEDKGYCVLYGDTDSLFIEVLTTKEDCIKLSIDLITELKKHFNFPSDQFDFSIENHLKYICFFKDKEGNFKKKNYLYVNDKDKLVVKGLDIIQRDCSALSIKVFNGLKNDIISKSNCKFSDAYIYSEIIREIDNDLMVVAKSFNLKDVTEYNSETTQYYKLSQRYGSGEIKLIPNTKVGIGNEIKYCSVSEAKNLKLGDIYIINIFEELAPFTIGGFKQHIINYKYKLKMNIDSNQRTLFGGG